MSLLIDQGPWATGTLLAARSRRVALPCTMPQLQAIAEEWGIEPDALVITTCARINGEDVVTVRAPQAHQRREAGLLPPREFTEGPGDECALCGQELAQHGLGITCPTA